jgi:hypothetical protein
MSEEADFNRANRLNHYLFDLLIVVAPVLPEPLCFHARPARVQT